MANTPSLNVSIRAVLRPTTVSGRSDAPPGDSEPSPVGDPEGQMPWLFGFGCDRSSGLRLSAPCPVRSPSSLWLGIIA